jgi:hypothetical protein
MNDDGNGDSGSRDRATVALVSAQIGEVKALVEGHKALTTVGFVNVQRQLDSLVTIPERVSALEIVTTAQRDRINDIEKAREHERGYRVGTLPMIVIGVCGLLFALLNIYLVIHGSA